MTPKIFESEYRFCQILWQHEPIKSTELAKLCAEKLGWSKTTTYTVIKRLCERGAIQNENTIVTSLISKEEAQKAELDDLMEKKFEGSLPAFIAAFAKSQKLSEKDILVIEGIHGLNEKISVETLEKCFEFYQRLLTKISNISFRKGDKNERNAIKIWL